MNNGATFNYDFGAKRHWRRTMWNGISEKIQKDAQDCTVLYFAGAEDSDFDLAVQKGFLRENMIAIERDKKVAKHLRKEGVPCVNSDAKTVITNWKGLSVDVVFLDFCCGATVDVMQTISLLSVLPEFSNAIVAVNVMRGREREGDAQYKHQMKGMHRGLYLYEANICGILEIAFGKRVHKWSFLRDLENKRFTVFPNEALNADENLKFHGIMSLSFQDKSEFHSYKSKTGQVFDSAIWNAWSVWNIFDKALCEEMISGRIITDQDVYRSLAAIKAIRTRALAA